MKKLILALLLLIPIAAEAAQFRVEWTAPTQRADSTALDPSDIKLFTIRFIANSVEVARYYVMGSQTSARFHNVEDYAEVGGDITVTVTCTDTDDQEGDPASETVNINTVGLPSYPAPDTPTGIDVTVEVAV